MATSSKYRKLAIKWKIKIIRCNGVWYPLKHQPDRIMHGDTSSQRIRSGNKFISIWTDFDNAYLYEVGEQGRRMATYNHETKKFHLDNPID
jgi:hypothetical protein